MTKAEPDGKQIAVALGYDKDKMDSPQVMASGKGQIAERIIELARENSIPVEKDAMLAEALGELELGQEIPADLYQVVAEILVFIMETDRNHQRSVKK